MVKEKTFFKSLQNPSFIDLFITNSELSFQYIDAIGISLYHHKQVLTVIKQAFRKKSTGKNTLKYIKKYIKLQA